MAFAMNVAYLGIDLLHPVLDAALREGCRVVKLFTCPTDNVTEFNTAVIATARERGIPWTMERLTGEDLKELERTCDLLLCAGYYYRVPVSPTLPMVNFHPAPLPMGRGPWPMPVILLRGLPEGGITAHRMAPELDRGDILLEETFPIRRGETLRSYMEQVYQRVPGMVRRLVTDLPGLLAQAKAQGEGDYWPSPTQEDWTVTPEMDVEQADRVLRAFYGYECVYRAEERRVELIGGRAEAGDNKAQPFPVRGGYIRAERIRNL